VKERPAEEMKRERERDMALVGFTCRRERGTADHPIQESRGPRPQNPKNLIHKSTSRNEAQKSVVAGGEGRRWRSTVEERWHGWKKN
jgi:hypothetical protein